ncbi:MAG: hypothetical protein JXA90_16235 [Planctomycetes bacterium]|nr:hypothetical protein [Planctomycetota bacterium]
MPHRLPLLSACGMLACLAWAGEDADTVAVRQAAPSAQPAATLRWRVSEGLSLLFGYARIFAGDFVRRTPGDHGAADWAFAQLEYGF